MAHLNSAEGIQNFCATQIMTKSKSKMSFFCYYIELKAILLCTVLHRFNFM